MTCADDVKVVQEFLSKRLRDAHLEGELADAATLDRIRVLLRRTLEEIRGMDLIHPRWDVKVTIDPATHVLHVTALPPWRDWVLRAHQHWRTLSFDPVPASDAEHRATRVTILDISEHKGRRNIRYAYVDYTTSCTFYGRDNDWEDDFRAKFPIPE